eukprot:TCALIF_02151-PA protein Name:"Similar to apcdd1 Protein APCDD1 (Xenopus tropicalis)" AED:0.11 eAED:0.11 QI:0/0.8/0.83/0.83/1/1/6/47/590
MAATGLSKALVTTVIWSTLSLSILGFDHHHQTAKGWKKPLPEGITESEGPNAIGNDPLLRHETTSPHTNQSHILPYGLLIGQDNDLCDRMDQHLRKLESRVQEMDVQDHLTGQWVSSQCEVRPGGQFLLRQYFFRSNGEDNNDSFILNQYHYSDRDCITPLYMVKVWGTLKYGRSSWLVPGSSEMKPTISRVGIVPFTQEASNELFKRTTRSCSFLQELIGDRSRWRTGKMVIVYLTDVAKVGKSLPVSLTDWVPHFRDEACLDSMNLDFHELQLMRIERRPIRKHHHKFRTHHLELLLGDIHTDVHQQRKYRPTAMQPYSLINANQVYRCKTCHKVIHATSDQPPRLHPRPFISVAPQGEWLSVRCETRPNTLFLRRRLRFLPNRTWMGTYRYFSDELCTKSVFEISAKGKFLPSGLSSKVDGGSNFEFKIKEASIKPQTESLARQLNAVPTGSCGSRGQWRLDDYQDITQTNGCKAMGLKIPIIEKDLLKIEIDQRANAFAKPHLLLYLGQTDTDQRESSSTYFTRPTSYQPPLIQCHIDPGYHILTNELFPLAQALRMSRNVANGIRSNVWIFLSTIIVNFWSVMPK